MVPLGAFRLPLYIATVPRLAYTEVNNNNKKKPMTPSDRYSVKAIALSPTDPAATQQALRDYEADFETVLDIGATFFANTAYASVTDNRDKLTAFLKSIEQGKVTNQVGYLAYRNDKPIGTLRGNVGPFLKFDNYLIATCLFLIVRPDERNGKAAKLLLSAFRDWATKCKADEMRVMVTSADHAEKTHAMLVDLMGFAHLGGNFAFPLSDKGQSVLGALPFGQDAE